MEFRDASTDELVKRFGDEYEKYWELSNSLTLKESRKTTGRKDLDQKEVCIYLEREILSRSQNEALKLRILLEDPRPGVRLMAARALESVDIEAAVSTYLELAQRNLGPDGYADRYGANARMALDRLVRNGKVPKESHPDYFDPKNI